MGEAPKMTPEEIKTALALRKCTFLPGSYEKRFVASMASIAECNSTIELSEKQKAYLAKVKHRYRKQLGIAK